MLIAMNWILDLFDIKNILKSINMFYFIYYYVLTWWRHSIMILQFGRLKWYIPTHQYGPQILLTVHVLLLIEIWHSLYGLYVTFHGLAKQIWIADYWNRLYIVRCVRVTVPTLVSFHPFFSLHLLLFFIFISVRRHINRAPFKCS